MNNSELFQKLADETAAFVGVRRESAEEPSVALFHVLACAMDWCEDRGVDFDATLEEVRACFLLDRSD